MFKFKFRKKDGGFYTGLLDKNGVEMCQNDIVKIEEYGITYNYKICFGQETIDDNEGRGSNKIIGFYLKDMETGELSHIDILFLPQYVYIIPTLSMKQV